MNLCYIFQSKILKFMLENQNKTMPNCFKNYLKTKLHQKPIIIRPGLLVMATELLHPRDCRIHILQDPDPIWICQYATTLFVH